MDTPGRIGAVGPFSIAVLLSLVLTSPRTGQPQELCLRETAIQRLSDHTRFWVAEIPGPAVVTEVSGDVRYQSNDSAPTVELRVGTELGYHTMVYLGAQSAVTGRCGETECLHLRTRDDPDQWVLFPVQCP